MSKRADYLSKYLNNESSDKPKKKKHKKKSSTTPATSMNIVVETPKPLGVPSIDNNEEYNELNQQTKDNEVDVDEFAPVKLKTTQKSNKGFKRIDNGDIITTNNTTTTTPPPSLSSSSSVIKPNKLQPNQETIYRDSSGRIINDIKQRQEDLQQQKLHEEQLKQFTEIKTSKQDQINQEQEIFKVKNGHVDNQFEDPMASFIKDTTITTITTTTKKEFEDVSKSKFVYNKGINIPNRFNIPAGYFWDGIDRSNGFEQMYLRKQTEYNYDKIDSKINETYEIDIGDD